MLTNYQIKLINIAVGRAKNREIEKLANGMGVSTEVVKSALKEESIDVRKQDN